MTTRTSRRINVTDPGPGGRQLDWILIGATVGLLTMGTLLVWSATRADTPAGALDHFLLKDLVDIAVGVVLAVVAMALDYRWVRIWAPVVYVAAIVGLVMVLSPLGAVVNGARSWIQFGGLSVQPAELAKLGVVVAIGLFLAERTETRPRAVALRDRDVAGALLIAAVPGGLILLQPDLGTALVLAATVFGMLAVGAAPKRWLAGLALATAGAA
ncbi:MAG: FtsW/RodA/SpoVE family cell cycle protein, partial [Sciscionella sp.]